MGTKIEHDLGGINDALEIELTSEQVDEIQNEADERFNEIEGVSYKSEEIDPIKKILGEFEVSKTVVHEQINSCAKIQKLIIKSIAVDPTDMNLISTAVQVMDTQSRNLKLLADLQNKTIDNVVKQTKVSEEKEPTQKKNNTPPGFVKKK